MPHKLLISPKTATYLAVKVPS